LSIFSPGAGAVVTGEAVQFRYSSGGPGKGNLVYGFYLVTADNVLYRVGTFGEPFPMQVPGVGFPVNWMLGYAAG
jgi:hypothetical protein